MEPQPVFPADLYRGTALFYERYRPAYPTAMLDDLCRRLPVSGTGGLLDLACGTGHIAVPLADRFAKVVAVDQEEESVAFGRAKAHAAGYHTIEWITGAAETVELDSRFELVAVGTAFHRLNRPVVAAHMFSWLRAGGGVALLWSDTPSQGDAAWQQALTELMSTWMARVGTAERLPPGWDQAMRRHPHEAVLASAGFEYLGKFDFRREERWTADTLLGFMYSTSILNQDALGGYGMRRSSSTILRHSWTSTPPKAFSWRTPATPTSWQGNRVERHPQRLLPAGACASPRRWRHSVAPGANCWRLTPGPLAGGRH